MKKKILASLAALAVLAAATGVASRVMAADNAANGSKFLGFGKVKIHQAGLTDTQKAEIKTKTEAVKAAEAAGDYNAWVAAVKALDANSPLLKRVTSAEAFKTYLEKNKAREAQLADRQAKMAAVTAALTAGNYDAWVQATKAIDANSPIFGKINADNFAKYAEAYKLRAQADEIMKGLGLGNGLGMGALFGGPGNGSKEEGKGW